MNHITSCLPKKVKQVYVLELESGKYYIGESINPKKRIEVHFNGFGSQWTKLYPPIQALKPFTKNKMNYGSYLKLFKEWYIMELIM